MGVFFSWFKVWYLRAEKWSKRDLPLSPTSVPRVLSSSSPLLLGWVRNGQESHSSVARSPVWKFCPLLKAVAEKYQ